mmetsp:Transcript_1210/g.2783  ORF Transcript_1210/g.2783 Transcript_1210/m.2783 type:complete len:99 (+) Transcript_1210:1285-1581(+)
MQLLRYPLQHSEHITCWHSMRLTPSPFFKISKQAKHFEIVGLRQEDDEERGERWSLTANATSRRSKARAREESHLQLPRYRSAKARLIPKDTRSDMEE